MIEPDWKEARQRYSLNLSGFYFKLSIVTKRCETVSEDLFRDIDTKRNVIIKNVVLPFK